MSVDENGRKTYTNFPKKGAKKLNLDPPSTIAAPKPRARLQHRPASPALTAKPRNSAMEHAAAFWESVDKALHG